jgi:hypothetical protein
MLFDKCGAKYQAIGQKNDPQTFQESRSFLERRKKKKPVLIWLIIILLMPID